ncbi:TetR/AcrR family transcriptional regulator [Aestuariivita sp.]|uniref:TetR/AcrR family transcriptional regulator n=1 Tax=Aestuariivita sp. TaxID=1872407 RepID=UPI00216F28E6|nr:TetR/AcrR family transcriptional regulator [Aestuariivita sp.]MCE8005657.1 TetR/AcrR family transcriptional regulator [Aestuariivita sp.]
MGASEADNTADRPARGTRRNKREEVLQKAAILIARQGFDGTSMRDIAAAVGMLPGSLYYHFPSKEDMLIAIHERVVTDMTDRVIAAIEGVEDPWERLEKASVAHLVALLEAGNMVSIISPNFPADREELNTILKSHRRAYERFYKGLFDALDLPASVDRGLLRLQLLGALNWVPVWYDPDHPTGPDEIARTFVRSICKGSQPD